MKAKPDILKSMLEVAKVQSTGASNRIEGIFTTDKRLVELVSEKAEPLNRDEEEIAGYREVLNTIHENYEHIILKPNVILQLHRDLYSLLTKSLSQGSKMKG
jgi:Fic family protein